MKRTAVRVGISLVVLFVGLGLLRAESPLTTGAVPPAADATQLRDALNLAWVLLCAFIIFFMQAGFALVETGLTRAKNVAHTMTMNVMIYCLGALGFWACGFALMFGNYGPLAHLGDPTVMNHEITLHLLGRDFGVCGAGGFFLAGHALNAGVLGLFLFQMMFLDTAATIPTGAMAERWKFLAFVVYGVFVSTILYPIYGNWVWGHGWLAGLGANFGLGHGHVDFAGSSVVHMVGGGTSLVGAYLLGPRIGKYRPGGHPTPLPAHNVPMYMTGTLFLALGWFGFNAGSTLSATDPNIARIAVNTALSSAAGAVTAMCIMWLKYKKPDPSFLCNGILAGLVAITAGCAYVRPWAAVLIGAVSGALVVWSSLIIERVLKVDDPVGAISIHGTNGIWGALALGLFADGTYAPHANFNGVAGPVTGLLYGDASQLAAQCVGVIANLLWVLPVAYGFFWVVNRLVGNRVGVQAELQGLDVPELGALGYITHDPKVPEGRLIVHTHAEPRPARVPPNGEKRFAVLVEGVENDVLAQAWSDLCRMGNYPPPPEFREVYPYMTTLQGNRFAFRGGNPLTVRASLERLLQDQFKDRPVRARLEG
ncbi:MAG TPA: ammonium transporter [Gemmataceae bacterium]|nr:ammonium transporter [Gemmataceae bacterium]